MSTNLTTELEIVASRVVAPRKIQVEQMDIQNFHLHTCVIQLVTILKALIKSGSGNASANVTPRDVGAIRKAWEGYKAAFDFALQHNDPPQINHELSYHALVPTKNELQKINNKKLKQVALQIDRLIEVIFSSDAANFSANIDEGSEADVNTQNGICEAAMLLWIGTGASNSETGLSLPVFKGLGTLKPSNDLDEATISERSPDRPFVGRPDVTDLPVSGD